MKRSLLLLLLLLAGVSSFAQDDLFGPKPTDKTRKGFIIVANAQFDVPAGDMAKRFGLSYRIGPGLLYKTRSNWVFGAKFDFISGNTIKEDSVLLNLRDRYGGFISNNGGRENVPIFERGYIVALQAGKILPLSNKNRDNGIMVLTAIGFIQHKLNIFVKDKDVPQLSTQYLKGYDRLSNGLSLEEYVAYSYLAKDGLLNFHIGIDCMVGLTRGRRDYLFDVMRPDNQSRVDILFGIRGGIYIPIFRRKSEELIFN